MWDNSEMSEDLQPCHDCGAEPGEAHRDGCDTARCLRTGTQRLACNPDDEHPEEGCGQDVWTGQWPGEADCIRLGWYSYFDPFRGWVRCGPDHPEAGPDLNRLRMDATWNRELLRWEAREPS